MQKARRVFAMKVQGWWWTQEAAWRLGTTSSCRRSRNHELRMACGHWSFYVYHWGQRAIVVFKFWYHGMSWRRKLYIERKKKNRDEWQSSTIIDKGGDPGREMFWVLLTREGGRHRNSVRRRRRTVRESATVSESAVRRTKGIFLGTKGIGTDWDDYRFKPYCYSQFLCPSICSFE